jgi:hypothetical protein
MLWLRPTARTASPLSLKSQTKLAVRTETHKLKVVVIWLAVNEHEIGPDVAIAMIAPFSRQGMIEVAARQWRIRSQQIHGRHQERVQLLAMLP